MIRALIPGQRTRALSALISCALLLSLAFAMPASAAGPLKLTAGSVDPDGGTSGDAFTFAATYVSKDDDPPAFVRVILDGKPHDLAPNNASDSDMRDGARYQIRIKIKATGSHAYSFAAQDSKGRQTSLAGGTFTVVPKPKPKATPRPVPKPAAKPASTSASSTTKGSPKPTEAPPSSPTDDHAAGAIGGLLLLDYDGGPGSGGPGGYPMGGAGPSAPMGGSTVGGPDARSGQASSDEGGRGSGTRAPAGGAIAALAATLPGFGSDEWLTLAARSAMVATGSAAVVAMALFTFKRRRREDEDPDEVPSRDDDRADAPSLAPFSTDAVLTGEMAMPRWRRPSLAQARKADPGTSLAAIEAERLTFTRGATGGDPGNERRRIRYRMVRLSDAPDEILGQEIGRLDQGDEVELLERSGLYWKVRTPLGEIGWVHKMTLGDVVTDVEQGNRPDGAEADVDVLAAFNEAQALRGFQPFAEPVLGEGLAARFIREHGVN